MAKPLIILGAGGNAYDVLDIVDAINASSPVWSVRGFLDDRRPVGTDYLSIKILGRLAAAGDFDGCWFINAVRNETTHARMQEILAVTGVAPARFATLVHPQASVSSRAELGCGVYVNYGVSVAGGVTLGHHVSLGPGCIVGHDTQIDDYGIVAAGAVLSGGVRVRERCYIGSGAMIRQQITIGRAALVGLGAVVVRDVDAGTVVVGNPARVLVPRENHRETTPKFIAGAIQ
jgi:sugar O-acyltransferase (sialic acid O-acetyltransferase NeuD family)